MNMWVRTVRSILLLALLSCCQGLRCWHCENQNSNWECLMHGRLKECLPNQHECQNELRFISNSRYWKITKGCKQNLGCDNNRNQNHLLKNTYRCEKRDVVDVCWCCCDTDNCNAQEVFCANIQPKCDTLLPPINGVVSCQRNDGKLGTNCAYRCRAGFTLVGSATTTCVRTATGAIWSSRAPSCEQVTCGATPSAIKNGAVTCTNGNSLYSTCVFECDFNYVLIGASSISCSHLGIWSDPIPACVNVACRVPRRINSNLEMDCSNGNRLGSICRFQCSGSYRLRGANEMACGEPIKKGFGRWNRRFPRCIRSACAPAADSNANRVCTDGNNIGSICTYSCDAGEHLVNGREIVEGGVFRVSCSRTSRWSGRVPTCRPIVCPVLPGFPNGNRVCSRGRRIGSECTHTCTSNYRLVGGQNIECASDTPGGDGVWKDPVPRCVEREPEAGWCLNYGDVANGEVECSPVRAGNGTHWLPGTVCGLQCSGGLVSPIGDRSTVTCTSVGWSGQLCCDRCLSESRLDVIVLMDSSYADRDAWDISKSFSSDFALYVTESLSYVLNFVIIPFATVVDAGNIVKANDITFDNYEDLASLSESIPFAGSGDSNTGVALQYVRENVLGELEDGSVPLVVILSNRPPNDNQLAVSEAQKLRDLRIHIRVVPFIDFYNADPGANRAVFEALTGGEENSVVDSDSVETFYEEAGAGIGSYATYCDNRLTSC